MTFYKSTSNETLDGYGFVEFTTFTAGSNFFVKLSDEDEYYAGFYVKSDGTFELYEQSGSIALSEGLSSVYELGRVFRIAKIDDPILGDKYAWYYDGQFLQYSTTIAPSVPHYVVVEMSDEGGSADNVVIVETDNAATVSVEVVDYRTYTPPPITSGKTDFTLAVQNGDNGRIYLYDGRVIDEGHIIRDGEFLPQAIIKRAFIGDAAIRSAHIGRAQINNAHIRFLRAGKIVADVTDSRIVFGNEIGSRNFVGHGLAERVLESVSLSAEVSGMVQGSTTLTRTLAGTSYSTSSFGIGSRGLHADDGYLKCFPSSSDYIAGLKWSRSGDYTTIDFSFHFESGGTVVKVKESNSLVHTVSSPSQYDEFRIRLVGEQVNYIGVDDDGVETILFTSSLPSKIPTFPFITIKEYNTSVPTPEIYGILEDRVQTKPHWQNVNFIHFDINDDLQRVLSGSTWEGVGANSVERVESGDCYVEALAPADGEHWTLGLSANDTDHDYDSINYTLRPLDAVYTSGDGYVTEIRELGVVKAYSPTLTSYTPASTVLRVAVEDGVVVYRRDGMSFYVSLTQPSYPLAVDLGMYKYLDRCKNVRFGRAGTSGRGWRGTSDGIIEAGQEFRVRGVSVDSIRARAIGAITDNLQYRGRDTAEPTVNRLTAGMFQIGSLRTLDSDVYCDLIATIPKSVTDNEFANFDSVDSVRVSVLNVFGEVVSASESTFRQRGKVVLGFFSRNYADPLEQAVFKIEFHNIHGWSRTPFYWTHASASGEAWGSSHWSMDNGSIFPPTWRLKTDFPSGVGVAPISDTSIRVTWTKPSTNSTSGSGFGVYYRPVRVGKNRLGWTLAASVTSADELLDISGLSPNTDYEFMVQGGGTHQRGEFSTAKTLPQPLAAAARIAPSGLSWVSNSTSTVDLNWVRNAADNDFVEVYRDGSLVHTTAGGSTVSWTDTGRSAGVTHTYKVRNKWSSGTTYSNFSNEVVATVLNNPPASGNDPTNLAANVVYYTKVRLTWDANGGSNPKVERSEDGVSFVTIDDTSVTSPYLDLSTEELSPYWYRIFNQTGGVNYSNVVQVTTGQRLPNDN